MDIRHAWPILAAAVLSSTVALAESSSEQSSAQTVKSKTDEMPVTLIGCIQRESDYRRANDRGRGGAVGLGLGSGDEFILVNASPVGAGGPAAVVSEAQPTGTSGTAQELPRTASPLPLVGLMGLLSLAGGFGLRLLRR